MTRKLILIGIVLVGFVLVLGSHVWAGHGKHGKRHHYDKGCHKYHKAHHGHHYGWKRWKRHHRRHHYRHHRPYRHRDYRPVVVEKHIYHEYRTEEPEPATEEEGFRFAFSAADEAVGISVEVSEVY